MGRVSENSSYHAINYSVGKSKNKLEDLQLKGSNLKKIQKPSDDPIGNIDILAIRSQQIDNEQYLRNSNYAKTQLAYTENAVEEITDIITKAKELAIGQASNFYAPEVRRGIAKEVSQLKGQIISIGNRRLGNKYLFAGHKTLTKPFDAQGNYLGDKATTTLEVAKDVFVPINFNGMSVFFERENSELKTYNPEMFPQSENQRPDNSLASQDKNDLNNRFREPAAVRIEQSAPNKGPSRSSLFRDLERLENALVSNNPELIQDLLPDLDKHLDRIIELRTKIGSVMNTIENSESNLEKEKVENAAYKSKVEDVDVAELFTDLTRQQNVLNATYKSSAQLMNSRLLDFIR